MYCTHAHMWPILSQQTEAGSPSEDKDVWEDEDEDEEQNIEGNDGTFDRCYHLTDSIIMCLTCLMTLLMVVFSMKYKCN